jgi:hypothetical protein
MLILRGKSREVLLQMTDYCNRLAEQQGASSENEIRFSTSGNIPVLSYKREYVLWTFYGAYHIHKKKTPSSAPERENMKYRYRYVYT